MKLTSIAIVAALLTIIPLTASARNCADINEKNDRVICYMKEIRQEGISWVVREEISDLDDSKNVFISVKSSDDIRGKYANGRGFADLWIRCMENRTSIYITMNDFMLSDIQGYGDITLRLDKDKATSISGKVSTDNMALGLWGGGNVQFLL